MPKKRQIKLKGYRVYYRAKDGGLDSFTYRGKSKEEAAKHFRSRGYKVVEVKSSAQL